MHETGGQQRCILRDAFGQLLVELKIMLIQYHKKQFIIYRYDTLSVLFPAIVRNLLMRNCRLKNIILNFPNEKM